jgi:hypothetical protein
MRSAVRGALVFANIAVLAACTRPLAPGALRGQAADPRMRIGVDRRVELISILCVLAHYPEYTQRTLRTPYAKDLLAHFTKYLDHPAVVATRQMRERFGIAYDAPITLAVQLDEKLQRAPPLSAWPVGLSERWKGTDLEGYLGLVRDFARDSGFDSFFQAERPYLDRVDAAFTEYLADKRLLPWFDGVFGRRENAIYRIVPAMLSGPNNWGVHAVRPDGTEEILQAMSLVALDDDAIPKLTGTTQWLLAHELAHPYVNPFVDRHWDELSPSLSPAFAAVRPAMERQAYPTAVIVGYESLARAVQILYLADVAGADAAKQSMSDQVQLGFVWMPALVDALQKARQEGHGLLTEESTVAALRAALVAWARER